MGGGRKAENDQRGMGADRVRAAGGDAGTGMGCYGHARWWNARTFDSSSGAGTEGVQEVHSTNGGA